MSIAVGDEAPDFELTTDAGTPFRLSRHMGHPVVMFFYPADNTEGCTIENIEFTALADDYQKAGVTVVGISPDSVEKHCSFRDKYDLRVPLLADPDRLAIGAYDVWGPKTLFGVHYDGLIRTTVLVAPDRRIAQKWVVRKIKGHAAEVLEAARALAA